MCRSTYWSYFERLLPHSAQCRSAAAHPASPFERLKKAAPRCLLNVCHGRSASKATTKASKAVRLDLPHATRIILSSHHFNFAFLLLLLNLTGIFQPPRPGGLGRELSLMMDASLTEVLACTADAIQSQPGWKPRNRSRGRRAGPGPPQRGPPPGPAPAAIPGFNFMVLR